MVIFIGIIVRKADHVQTLYHILDGYIPTQIAIQPIVALQNGTIFAHEVLARWNSINPFDMFAVASVLDLVDDLERTILAQVHYWRSHVQGHLFVNVYPTLLNPDIWQHLADKDVILEITEAAAINYEGVQTLRTMGFALALDDIGTGSSTLLSLLTVKPDFLKLDKTLTQTTNIQARNSLLQALVDYAQRIESQVILEGVETKEQFMAAKTTGCHFAQGYFLGKPKLLSH